MKLGLGTVQFGLDYGISNPGGRTPESEVRKILELASRRGVSILDTASQYGNSEEIIGLCLPETHSFKIVSKTPSFRKAAIDPTDALFLKSTLNTSIKRLKQRSLYGLLIHHADDLLSCNGAILWRAMEELKDAGMVEKIGVSVYSPDQLDAILCDFRPDLVQLPLNVLDQRMIRGGYLRKLKDLGVEIHGRSVFLQGLLLMGTEVRPDRFTRWQPLWTLWDRWLRETQLTALKACLGFAFSQPEIDRVIVGVDSYHHLEEILLAANGTVPLPPAEFNCEDIDLINPSRWSQL